MKKAYFQYYETFEKIVQKFDTAESRESIRVKIINYGFYGEQPTELTEKEELVWDIVKDLIDDQVHRREVNAANRKTKIIRQPQEEQPAAADPAEQPADFDVIEKTIPHTTSKRFTKPTVEEIKNYCQERNNGLNAQQFYDFYEAKGWKVGSAPMKDWKACVRTWEQRHKPSAVMPHYELPPDRLTL